MLHSVQHDITLIYEPPEEILDIQTPENVAFGFNGRNGSRFLAAMVDTFIILLLQFVVLVAFFAILNV